jgi:ubiquitin-like modifier-activating enzyme ATG7
MSESSVLKFVSPKASFEHSFWLTLYRLKLEEYKLDVNEVDIVTRYNNIPNNKDTILTFDCDSFNTNNDNHANHERFIKTKMFIYDNLQSFKDNTINQNNIITPILWSHLFNTDVFDDHTSINLCALSVYVDLKKYKFYYWFSFPVFQIPYKIYLENYYKISNLLQQQEDQDIIRDQIRGIWIDYSDINIFVMKELIVYPFTSKYINEIDDYTIIVADMAKYDEYPGWIIRNLLFALAYHIKDSISLSIVCYRESFDDIGNSIMFNINLHPIKHDELQYNEFDIPKFFKGFATNKKNLCQPSVVDMSMSMSSEKLAQSALNLNTKLMKWRVSKRLNLDKIANTKCLLIGAGTLGCHVARTLLGWGITNITFVDYGVVSHSNPARQSLYHPEDVGKPKAKTAAINLKKIYKMANTKGIALTVPMPGHKYDDDKKLLKDMELLDQTIREHNAVFLLTDTRESRWLPTLLTSTYSNIMCFTCAIGFDTFVAMRHGLFADENQTPELACYFCADTLEPSDTITDASMDERCTVSRPGVSAMAAAFVSELLIACLVHKQKLSDCFTGLPKIPQQIRGDLSTFSLNTHIAYKSECCIACSTTIFNHFSKNPITFVTSAINIPGYLSTIIETNQNNDATSCDFPDENNENIENNENTEDKDQLVNMKELEKKFTTHDHYDFNNNHLENDNLDNPHGFDDNEFAYLWD